MPVVESPRLRCVVLFADSSAVDTRSRESRVASDVCFTNENRVLAFSMVLNNPVEPGAKYSARESKRQQSVIDTEVFQGRNVVYLSALLTNP